MDALLDKNGPDYFLIYFHVVQDLQRRYLYRVIYLNAVKLRHVLAFVYIACNVTYNNAIL